MLSPNTCKGLSLTLRSVDGIGSAFVRHFESGRVYHASWEDGILTEFSEAPEENPGSIWIAPGLLDLQVNGYAGVDFQRDNTADQMDRAVTALRNDGCHRILLTLITAPWEKTLTRVSEYRRLFKSSRKLSRAIPGWHIEGPFLSPIEGYRGAHNPEWMEHPTVKHIRDLKSIVEDDPLLLTIAPECPGAIPAIAEAVQLGFTVSVGHTNASEADLQMAIQAGSKAFTHLGNGCPQTLDRHANIIWRAIDASPLIAGIIPDGLHISPPTFRGMHRALGNDRVYWTTDAMSAAGADEGTHTIGEVSVNIGPDRVVRNPHTGMFAGSALEPIRAIEIGAQMLGISWQNAWNYLSACPARLMNMPLELTPGSLASFCLIEAMGK